MIPTPAPTPPHRCGNSSIPYLKGCYTLIGQEANWTAAEATCRERGEHLVDIHDAGENAAVFLMMSQLDTNATWTGWTGFYKKQVCMRVRVCMCVRACIRACLYIGLHACMELRPGFGTGTM